MSIVDNTIRNDNSAEQEIRKKLRQDWEARKADAVRLYSAQEILNGDWDEWDHSILPASVLPPRCARFATQVASATNTPIDFPIWSMLGVASGVMGRRFSLDISQTHREYPCLWLMLVASSGEGKSPVRRIILNPVSTLQREGHTIMIDDITGEALVKKLSENPNGLLSYQDEGTAWVGNMNKYRTGGKGSDVERYMQTWGGDEIRVDRSGSDTLVAADPFLTVVGNLTPGSVPAVGKGGNGFIERMLFIYPEPKAPRYGRFSLGQQVDTECINDWDCFIRSLAGETKVRTFSYSTEAQAISDGVHWRLDLDRGEEDTDSLYRSCLSKLKAYSDRLALILHTLDCLEEGVWHPEIGEGVMRRVECLIDYLKHHLRKTHKRGASTPSLPPAEVDRLVLDWCRRQAGEIEVSKAQGGIQQLKTASQEVRASLERLAGRGDLVRVTGPRGGEKYRNP